MGLGNSRVALRPSREYFTRAFLFTSFLSICWGSTFGGLFIFSLLFNSLLIGGAIFSIFSELSPCFYCSGKSSSKLFKLSACFKLASAWL